MVLRMRRVGCSRSLVSAAGAVGLLVWAGSPARAAEADYCVTCKNPDQVYRCRVTGAGGPNDALKLYCVIRTAKEGNHASCAATAASPACHGIVKVYAYDGPKLPENLTSDPRIRELKQRIEHDQRAFAKPKGDAPKTLFELGGRAVSASRKGLQSAGEVLGVTSSPADQAPPATTGTPQPVTAPPHLPQATNVPTTTASVSQPAASEGTVKHVKRAAQSASSAVGSFARKSYRCVLSLFRHCSGKTQEQSVE
jgi:hypothetical protein